ncbi:MAG TPA: helix-turn-helix transcriptional regulator [Acidimicrobiia bacterium]|jgi:DNA-binding PadR family transcriptional regulator|nr:helix-turn-helix transcriptional regulator [Acidimicrobiia bacterium]
MLELAILGLLKEFPLHGYELKKRLNETLGHVWGVSYGSLYPALARLERMGAIEVVDPPAAAPVAIPSTGSIAGEAAAARLRRPLRRSGRTRKAYRIATTGQTMFHELLRADPAPGADENRAFALKLAFCRHLEPPARLEILQRRREQLVEKLARGRQALAAFARAGRGSDSGGTPTPRPDRYTRALIEHETTTAERDLEWVDSLIAAERGPEIETDILQGRTT